MFSVSVLEPWGPFLEAWDLTFEDLVIFGDIFGAEHAEHERVNDVNDNPGPGRDFGRFLEVQKLPKNMFFLNIDFFMKKHDFLRIVLAP